MSGTFASTVALTGTHGSALHSLPGQEHHASSTGGGIRSVILPPRHTDLPGGEVPQPATPDERQLLAAARVKK